MDRIRGSLRRRRGRTCQGDDGLDSGVFGESLDAVVHGHAEAHAPLYQMLDLHGPVTDSGISLRAKRLTGMTTFHDESTSIYRVDVAVRLAVQTRQLVFMIMSH